jgi:hypothetical protein
MGVDMNVIVGSHDVLFVTLDTLRYDVAREQLEAGRTPTFARLLGGRPWEMRHSPGSFTYAAHQAFFAGFLPTPAAPGRHARLFALRFDGSVTTGSSTCVLDEANVVAGLRARGYHTACVGGVGFFNKQNPLGRALPSLFDESHWSPAMGVTDPGSTENQVACALDILRRVDAPCFLFLNVSALHQPNHFYLPSSSGRDTRESHGAALEYVDASLAPLFDAARKRRPTFFIVCSDHGTAYGEDGYSGHRVGHPVVWTVPYADGVLT